MLFISFIAGVLLFVFGYNGGGGVVNRFPSQYT